MATPAPPSIAAAPPAAPPPPLSTTSTADAATRLALPGAKVRRWSTEAAGGAGGGVKSDAAPLVLLVIDYDSSINWYAVFAGCVVELDDGTSRPVQVEQTAWDNVSLAATGDSCIVDIRKATVNKRTTQPCPC